MNRNTLLQIVALNITLPEVNAWNTAHDQNLTRPDALDIITEGAIQIAVDVQTRREVERIVKTVRDELARLQTPVNQRLMLPAEQSAVAAALSQLEAFDGI